MAQTLRLVDRDVPGNVLFDFDDHLGTVNPSGLITILQRVGLGTVSSPIDLVKAHGSANASRVMDDPQVRKLVVTMDVYDPNNSLRTLARGIGELYRILQSDSAFYRLIAWNDGSGLRYLEPIGIEGAVPSVREEVAAGGGIGAAVARGEDASLTLEIICQPFLLTDELSSDVNVLLNASLMVEGSTANRPTDWAWDSTSNISFEALNTDAYGLQSATASARNLQQMSPVGSCTVGLSHTFSFWAKAGVDSIYNVAAVIRYADAAGSFLAAEVATVAQAVDTSWSRYTITAGAAPASTSRAQVSIRVTNPTAGPVGLTLRDAQLETASTATPFRVGSTVVQANPSSIYGGAIPVVIDGDAPAPVTFDITGGTASKLTSVRMGARWNRGKDGTLSVPDFLNQTLWAPASATADGWTVTNNYAGAVVADGGTASGNALQVTVASGSNGVRMRRLRAARTTKRDSLRGEFAVYAAVAAQEGDIEWLLQMHYGSYVTDPLPNSEEPVFHFVAGDAGFEIGYEYVYLGVFRSSEFADITAAVIELWVARRTDSPSTAHLNISHLAFVPYEQRTRLMVPGGGSVTWKEEDFTTGGSGIVAVAGDPNWTAGELLDGGGYLLNASGEGVGVKPGGTGQAYGSGVVEIEFAIRRADEVNKGSKGYMCRLVDTTGLSQPGVPQIVGSKEITKAKTYRLRVTVNSGHLYQPQVTHRGGAGNRLIVGSITKTFIPALQAGERIVADPEHYEITKRDASGNVQAVCDTQGQTPFVLEPGRYAVTMLPGEISKGNHDDDNIFISHSFTVRTRYTPRWTQ